MTVTTYLQRSRTNGTAKAATPLLPASSARSAMEVVISPTEAETILAERNPRNRPLNKRHVEAPARDMKAGRWRVNGEAVKFDHNGNLLDAQHRLAACVLSGVPLRTWAVFGLLPDDYETIDRGRRKHLADDLARAGETSCHNLAAVLKLAVAIAKGTSIAAADATGDECRDFLEVFPVIRASASYSNSSAKTIRFMTPRLISYCHFAFSRISPHQAEDFFACLKTGAELAPTSPILALRTRLIGDMASKARLSQEEILALTIKAWNAYLAGRPCRHLSWRSSGPKAEAFPVPE